MGYNCATRVFCKTTALFLRKIVKFINYIYVDILYAIFIISACNNIFITQFSFTLVILTSDITREMFFMYTVPRGRVNETDKNSMRDARTPQPREIFLTP